MIDEITEVGNYTFQIRLLDENKESRVTIPEVVNGIEIREPIDLEDATTTNEVNVATVGYAMTTAGTPEDAFDSQGNYIKTNWKTGVRITAAKLNKIDAGIDGVNKKIANAGGSGEVDLSSYAKKTDLPTKTSQLANDSGYITNIPDEYITEAELTAKGYATTSQIPTVPTNVSELTNDAHYASETFVTNKIAEASLSGGGGEVDLTGYVTKELGNASQITFADGQTFQAKLDAGILKGDKGDQGEQGIQGEKGDKGEPGEPGSSNINDTTAGATTTYSSNKIETIIGSETLKTNAQDIKGAINEVFQNASNGKVLIANAITGMGVEANPTDTFEELADKILLIVPTVYGNIIVDATNLEITEGGTSTFTVHLDQAPTNDQVINITSDNSKVTINPSTLTFTPSNYNTTQTVTVSAENDTIEDNGYTLTLTLSSSNVENVVIDITVKDNDIAINWHTVTTDDVTISTVAGVNCITAINTTEQYLDLPSTLPCFRLSSACDTVKGIKFNEGGKAEWESAAYSLVDRLPNVEIVTGGGINLYDRTGNVKTTMPFIFNGKDTNIKEFTFYPIGLANMNNMFKGMTKLAKVFRVPSTVTSWDFAFNGCINLHNVTVESDILSLNTSLPAFTGVPSCIIRCNDNSVIHNEIVERCGKPQINSLSKVEIVYFESLNGVSPKNINCFGDSLTHGINNITPYPKYLQDMLNTSEYLVYNVSEARYTSQQIKESYIDICYPYVKDIAVIWSGSNDENKTATKEQLVSNVQTLVSSLPPGINYVVVGLITYQWSQEVDDAFEIAFGDKFLNMHDYLCSNKAFTDIGETPTSDDIAAINNNNVPPSLIQNYHQTELGAKATAYAIKEKLLSLGYI